MVIEFTVGKGVSKEFLGEEKEDLIKYANSFNADLKPDYFIFGHRHLAKRITLKNNSEMILLGDWIKESSYASWDGKNLVLNKID